VFSFERDRPGDGQIIELRSRAGPIGAGVQAACPREIDSSSHAAHSSSPPHLRARIGVARELERSATKAARFGPVGFFEGDRAPSPARTSGSGPRIASFSGSPRFPPPTSMRSSMAPAGSRGSTFYQETRESRCADAPFDPRSRACQKGDRRRLKAAYKLNLPKTARVSSRRFETRRSGPRHQGWGSQTRVPARS
jgi:hypothetical protein